MNVQQMMGSTVVRTFFVAALVSGFTVSARADIVVGFGNGESDFTGNFYVSRGTASQFAWQSGGWMRFSVASTAHASLIYDTKDPPSYDAPRTMIGGGTQKEVYSIDFLVGDERESAGISARIQGTTLAGTGGYGVWLNLVADTKKFDLYRLTSVHAGASLVSATLEPNLIVAGVWYTLSLTLQNVGGNVVIASSIKNRATGAAVGGTITFTDSDAGRVTSAGRVGLRVQTSSYSLTYADFDNFSAVIIPDPPRGTLVSVR